MTQWPCHSCNQRMVLSNATQGSNACQRDWRLHNAGAGVQQDFALAVAQLTFARLRVLMYCVQQAHGVAVYQVTSVKYYTLPDNLMEAALIKVENLALFKLLQREP